MTRRRDRHGRAARKLIAVSVLALAGCSESGSASGTAAAVEAVACRRIAVETPTGGPLVGIEDIAVDHARGLAYLSSYDRRAVEAELSTEAGPRTRGGLYLLDLSLPLEDRAMAVPLLGPEGDSPVQRPHGIALDPAGGRLAAIDRRYGKSGGRWALDPKLVEVMLTADGRAAESAQAESLPDWLCSPNDLAYAGEALLLTSDRGRCRGVGRLAEDILGLTGAFVARRARDGWEIAVRDAPFANGVSLAKAAPTVMRLAVAASRAGGIFFFPADAQDRPAGQASRFLDLGAAPDNISQGPDGALYVAAHPSLLAFALYRAEWPGFAKAPSAVYKVTLEQGRPKAERIFHDPTGRIISAATVAAPYRERLLLGAAFDVGIAVCDLGAGKG